MMNFNTTPQFDKEFKKFSKKYVSLEQDIQTFKNIIQVNPKGNSQHFRILKQQDTVFVIKARFACRSLKIGTSGTPLRVIYVYNKPLNSVVFIEMYHKKAQSNPDKKRIEAYMRGLGDAKCSRE